MISVFVSIWAESEYDGSREKFQFRFLLIDWQAIIAVGPDSGLVAGARSAPSAKNSFIPELQIRIKQNGRMKEDKRPQ